MWALEAGAAPPFTAADTPAMASTPPLGYQLQRRGARRLPSNGRGGLSGTHDWGLLVERRPSDLLNGVAASMQGTSAAGSKNSSSARWRVCLPRA